MKREFIDKRFRQDTLDIIYTCEDILDEYAAQGLDLTLRQLYYQMIRRDLFPESWADKNGVKNRQQNYSRLGGIVNNGRMAGLLDWDLMVDRGRRTISQPHWDNPAAMIDSAAAQFRINKWLDQPSHIEVMCEKQALEGVLLPVCRELDVNYTSNKGYASQSFMYEKARELDVLASEGKGIIVLYVGDHDPSGIDMDRDIEDRLFLFMSVGYNVLNLNRLALTMGQINHYEPPPNPAKITDSRAKKYISKYGRESWELDALEPRVLADLVKEAVKENRDDHLWEMACIEETEMREEMRNMADAYRRNHP